MNALQEVVLATLPENKLYKESALQLLESEATDHGEDLIPYIEQAEYSLKEGEGIWEAISLLVVLAYISYTTEPPGEYIGMLIRAAEIERPDSRQELEKAVSFLRKDIEDHAAWQRKSDTLSDIYSQIQFLADILGANTVPILMDQIGATQSTVKKWVAGKSPSYANARTISRLAEKIYDAREEERLDEFLLQLHKEKKHKKRPRR